MKQFEIQHPWLEVKCDQFSLSLSFKKKTKCLWIRLRFLQTIVWKAAGSSGIQQQIPTHNDFMVTNG